MDALDAATDQDDRALRLHEVRKAAKRLRYGTEALVPAYGKRAGRLVKSVRRVQTILGEHQDSVMAQRYLRSVTDSAALSPEEAFALGVMHAREDENRDRDLRRLDKAWSAASRPKLRRWLT